MKQIITGLFIVCFLTITGCSGSIHSLTQTTGRAIIAKAISAMSLVKSYNLSTDLTENYTVFEKNNPQTTTDHWEWKSRRCEQREEAGVCEVSDSRISPHF